MMTADDLILLPEYRSRHELIRGKLKVVPWSDVERSRIAALIIGDLLEYVRMHGLGVVLASAGFCIARNPDTVIAPDVAFIRAERAVITTRFFEGPPDVAFQIGSSVQWSRWLRAGTRAVVIVDPRTKSARIHRPGNAVDATEAIEIDDVIPGWRLPLSELFAEPAF